MSHLRRRSSAAVIAALAVASAGRVVAQNTSRLGSYERDVQYQVGLAVRSPLVGSEYGAQTGELRAIDIAVLLRVPEAMRARLDGWVIERRPGADGRFFNNGLKKSLALAVVASGQFQLRLTTDLSLEPIIGLGLVPYARGDFAESVNGNPTSRSQTGQGILWDAGLALRWRHIVVEQHVLQITGADGPLRNGETAPLAIALRF